MSTFYLFFLVNSEKNFTFAVLKDILVMKEQLIGRQEEIKLIESYLSSEKSEFIAVYGRRRVGKTYLIRQMVSDRASFVVSGMNDVPKEVQLMNFDSALRNYCPNSPSSTDWLSAFENLANYLSKLSTKVKIIFIDEMPWMDTPKSNFVSALEHFWNSWAAWRDDIKLIVCGSATSWMLDNVINSHGGLHNRVTHQIIIKPFKLRECKEYFRTYKFPYGEREIMECYMVFGGIPYYLSLMDRQLSVAQNIDRLIFSPSGELRNEMFNLFRSLFRHSEDYELIIKTLSTKKRGLTRSELVEMTKQSNNARLTKMLRELEECSFIRSYTNLNRKSRLETYQLTDPFIYFNFSVVEKKKNNDDSFWTHTLMTPLYYNWSGLAFEILCINHLDEIKVALGINGIVCGAYSWRTTSDDKPGAQVDLVIERADNTANLCEMKYSVAEYAITAEYEQELARKVQALQSSLGKRTTIRLTMITNNGLKRNGHDYIVTNEVKTTSFL